MTRRSTAGPRRCLARAGWALVAFALTAALPRQPLPKDLLGAWKNQARDELLLIGPEEVVVSDDGHLAAKRVLGFGDGKLFLRSGLVEVWSVACAGGVLHVVHGTRAAAYGRLRQPPPALTIRARRLGDAVPVSPERRREIQDQLRARVQQDQAVRRPPFDLAKLAAVDAADAAFLGALVNQVGWIDAERFGLQASGDAFLLVQHSRDLPLQLAVLPLVEHDARRQKGFGQAYALLFDRTQVALGRRQRYGSQLDTDAAGDAVVLPLEDAAHVDALRAEIGLAPLQEYLDMTSKALLQGKPIHLAADDDLEAAEPAPPGAPPARPRVAGIAHPLS